METNRIKVMDVVDGTATNSGGHSLYLTVKSILISGAKAQLDMRDLTPMSTSFLNSSFGNLVDEFGVEKIKSHVSLSNVKKSDAHRISTYMKKLSEYA